MIAIAICDDEYNCMDDFKKEFYANKIIKLDNKEGPIMVNVHHVLFITSLHNGSELWGVNRNYISKLSLNQWQELLEKDVFFRCHKSSIVNLGYIKTINQFIELKNGERVQVSRRNRKELKVKFTKYISENAK